MLPFHWTKVDLQHEFFLLVRELESYGSLGRLQAMSLGCSAQPKESRAPDLAGL